MDTVSQQTFTNFEHIIIDGYSTDNTKSIIKQHRNEFVNFLSEPDTGIYDAMNKGIEMARGEYVLFLNSDDFFTNNNVLSSYADVCNSLAPDIVYSNLYYVQPNGRISRTWLAGDFHKRKLYFGWMPPHPTTLIRRNVFERIGAFDLRYSIAADYDLLLRAFQKKGLAIHYLNVFSVYMLTGGESNRSLNNLIVKSYQDCLIAIRNGLFGPLTVLFKQLRKLPQVSFEKGFDRK